MLQFRTCRGLADKGFASTNVVFGIGSYTYQYVTRDTFGWAMKATYGEVVTKEGKHLNLEIFKDPITDDGTKKSARGLLCITDEDGTICMADRQSWEQESSGLLRTVFHDGKLVAETSLKEIRERLEQLTVSS